MSVELIQILVWNEIHIYIQGKIGMEESIPYANETFDLVFSDNVVEHLSDPNAVLNEVRRVLKPGGLFFAKTPNKKHYMPLIVV